MGIVEWLLLAGGQAVRWAVGELARLAIWLFELFSGLLNPVLAPLISALNTICGVMADAVYAGLSPLPVFAGLVIVSVVIGVGMLFGFKYTSNQVAISQAKDAIKANLLALKLYKDDLYVTGLSQWRLLKAVGRLQRHMFAPILILALPMLVVLSQLAVRYQWRPLRPGERAIITARISKEVAGPGLKEERARPARSELRAESVVLEVDSGLEVEVGPVAGGDTVTWRVLAVSPGRHHLRIRLDNADYEKEMVVGEGLEAVSAERVGGRWVDRLLHPLEPTLPKDGAFESIAINYPGRSSYLYGADWWVVSFFAVSMIAALVLAPVFRVRF